MKKKQLYETPSVETYDLVLERVIADSNKYGDPGKAGGQIEEGESYDFNIPS